MADNNEPKDDGLDTLPPQERKETEDIIKEIEGETQPDKPAEKLEEKPKVEKPKEPKEEKPKEDSKGDDKKDEERPRKPILMPKWQHEIAEEKWKKREAELQTQLEDARKNSVRDDKKADEDKSQTEVDTDLRKKTDAIAEKYGTDPDEEYDRARAARETTRREQPKVEIPKDVLEGIEKIKTYEQAQQLQAEEAHFTSDFDAKILPLVKAEYGDDVPASAIEKIKEQVKAKAYSEEYAKVPLSTIYKGEDEFRGVIPAKQRGSEASRGGYHQSQEAFKGDELDLNTEQSPDVVDKMTPEQFDKYSDNMARKERR